jgi:hypothetical protein
VALVVAQVVAAQAAQAVPHQETLVLVVADQERAAAMVALVSARLRAVIHSTNSSGGVAVEALLETTVTAMLATAAKGQEYLLRLASTDRHKIKMALALVLH